MLYFSLMLLGLIQGLAEFLPVSSSGHLAIFKHILPGLEQFSNDITLDILLHMGTLIAVLIVYRKTVFGMIKGFGKMVAGIYNGTFRFRKADKYQLMCIYVALASIPLVIAAFLKDFVENLSSLAFVGAMLLVTAALLFIADHSVRGNKEMRDMKSSHALKIGMFQLFATLPGISRSGSTIAAALNMGFTKETAVEFSFIMGIPAIIGANILNISDVVSAGINKEMILPYIVATLTATVFGILAIKFVKYITKKDCFGVFTVYCALAGITAIVLSIIG